jgi:pimeloyl-ACP methyl ester carboxylesterase
MTSIYTTEKNRQRLLSLYDRAWAGLKIPHQDHVIQTRYGDTHVVTVGPLDAPPVVIFHGGNMISPVSFAWMKDLTPSYRFYAPDTVGHPGYSAETRLNPASDQYGRWAADVIQALRLEQPIVLGGSYGAGILLNLATVAPQSIGKAALVVPSGFVAPPLGPMIMGIVLPMLLYRATHQRRWLVRSLSAMSAEPDELLVEATGAVYDGVHIEAHMPHCVTAEALRCFSAPTLVLAAEKDVLFPAQRVLTRARQVIPNLTGAEVLAGSSHVLPQRLWPLLCRRLDAFFRTPTGP